MRLSSIPGNHEKLKGLVIFSRGQCFHLPCWMKEHAAFLSIPAD